MSHKTKPKRRLGRGLDTLIHGKTDKPAPAVSEEDLARIRPDGHPTQLAIADITTNPHQPRSTFDPTELAELASSIRQDGVLQPLIVTDAKLDGVDAKYILIAGERRLRASTQAGLSTVPCVVRQATERQVFEWAIIENVQRSDLNPIEKADSYRNYMDRYELTQKDAAERLGQARATVANYVRLNQLEDETKEIIASRQISFGHAKVLASLLESPERQVNLARRSVAEGLSVRKLEQLAVAEKPADKPLAEKPVATDKPAYVRDIEEQLTQAIGTKVNIKPGRKKHTGKIVVEYYSLDDFDRIANSLGLKDEF
ncbi:MAG: ParB/RepB/Spo0J family partition protein [Phycisphaerales bacterium]|jgi:ParB family transcriptional regulator, chromosome partitioning protein|nr:ParB/RepB/Spo0J family partition protein [Phycisphaerales bacterium]MBT7171045.1 ParB/RepB/Spo0J family partition protein [Phycisphaerales bacterium]